MPTSSLWKLTSHQNQTQVPNLQYTKQIASKHLKVYISLQKEGNQWKINTEKELKEYSVPKLNNLKKRRICKA